MNKKEAIAYAQVTLNYMQSSKYKESINPITFGIEMKQAFRQYPRSIILNVANAQIDALEDIYSIKNGCDIDEG